MKNPLFLTDYGFGQLIKDAINHGYKKINICLGGTSTVCFGIGIAQALGVVFYDTMGQAITKPIIPLMFSEIARFEFDKRKYDHLQITVINDSDAKAFQMDYTSRLKIGEIYKSEENEIMAKLRFAGEHIYRLTNCTPLEAFSGNAGGAYYGIEMALNPVYVRGTDYFIDLFDIKRKIKDADIVITGEGKFDCVEVSKMPVCILKLTQIYHKPAVLIAGQIEESLTPSILRDLGVADYICCQSHYEVDSCSISQWKYADAVVYYKKKSPEIIDKYLTDIMSKVSIAR